MVQTLYLLISLIWNTPFLQVLQSEEGAVNIQDVRHRTKA
jgi:hypothetical protein